jgi:uncharacterized protein (DUF433 family)
MDTGMKDRHIEVTPGVRGSKPRVAGRRITVADIVVWHEWMGRSADELATDYDLSLADIYSALAYYYDHREEIDASIRDSQAFAESVKHRTPSKLPESLVTGNE